MSGNNIILAFGKRKFKVSEGFRFLEDVGTTSSVLYCAKFDPPLTVDDGLVRYVHCSDFSFSRRRLRFVIEGLRELIVDTFGNIEINISIVTPVAEPQLSSFNKKIIGDEEEIFAHIFFLPSSKKEIADLQFMKSVNCKWVDLSSEARNLLKTAKKGDFGISFGIIDQSGVMPDLKAIDSFFSVEKSFNQGLKVIIVVVSCFSELTFRIGDRFVSVENLPRIPKDIILRIRAARKGPFTTIERRAIKACLNGGIPVNYFDSGLNVEYRSCNLKTSDFDQIELFVGNSEMIAGDILFELRRYVETFHDHIDSASSGATFRSLFWDPILSYMFLHGSEGDKKGFRLFAEWGTKLLFTGHRTQWVDYTAVIKLGDQVYPVLLVEIGKETFNAEAPHKDHSKLLSLMSQACLKLAKALIEKKKRPEVVRVGGFWIGGLTIQFIVAHPVVTEQPNGRHEVHVHLTTNPDWYVDLSVKPEQPKLFPSNRNPGVFEKLKTGDINLKNYNLFKADKKLKETSLDKPGPVSSTERSLSSKEVTLTDPEGLEEVNYHVQYMKSRVSAIHAELNKRSSDPRNFDNNEFSGVLVPARLASGASTPLKDALKETSGRSPSKNRKAVKLTKRPLKEVELLLKLSSVSTIFPFLFDFEFISATPSENTLVEYEVEAMEPIFDLDDWRISQRITFDNPLETFYASMLSVMQTVYCLRILHETFGVIHSNISISSIMYSTLNDTWKLAIFDQFLEKKPASVEAYIAPEALESGIFTKESDIYSLGKVFRFLFDGLILEEICTSLDTDLVNEEVVGLGDNFLSILEEMTHEDPSKRPTTFEVIDKLYPIINDVDIFEENPINRPISMMLRLKHGVDVAQIDDPTIEPRMDGDSELPQRRELPFTELSSKRTRVIEEERDSPIVVHHPVEERNI